MSIKKVTSLLVATSVLGIAGGVTTAAVHNEPNAFAKSERKKPAKKTSKKTTSQPKQSTKRYKLKSGKVVHVTVNKAPKTIKHQAIHQRKAKLDKGYKGYQKHHGTKKAKPVVAKNKHGKTVKNRGLSKKQTQKLNDFYAKSQKTKGSKRFTHKQAKKTIIKKSDVKIDK